MLLILAAILTLGQDADEGIDALIDKLDSDSVEDRDRAEESLKNCGESAQLPLKRVAAGKGESAIRARRILRWIDFASLFPPLVRSRAPDLIQENQSILGPGMR